MTDKLILGGHEFTSRFILGSGKYSLDLINAAVQNAGAEIITLALRRANQGGNAQHPADKSPVHAEDDAHPQHSQNDDIHDIHAFSFRRPSQVGSSTT